MSNGGCEVWRRNNLWNWRNYERKSRRDGTHRAYKQQRSRTGEVAYSSISCNIASKTLKKHLNIWAQELNGWRTRGYTYARNQTQETVTNKCRKTKKLKEMALSKNYRTPLGQKEFYVFMITSISEQKCDKRLPARGGSFGLSNKTKITMGSFGWWRFLCGHLFLNVFFVVDRRGALIRDIVSDESHVTNRIVVILW